MADNVIARIEAELPPDVFDHAAHAFGLAQAAAGGGQQRFIEFAGQVARVHVVGTALCRVIDEAFPHLLLKSEGVEPSRLSIDLWDVEETDIPCSDVPLWNRARSTDGRIVQRATPIMASWLDRDASRIVGCVKSARQLSVQERCRPLFSLLTLWLADRGIPSVHAGAVGRGGSAVLVVGHAGAGKSTVSLACLQGGFDYLGDDVIAIARTADGGFNAYSVYATLHLDADHLRRFSPVVTSAVRGPSSEEEKAIIEIGVEFPERLTPVSRIRAIVMPRVVGEAGARLKGASRADVLLAMAPASLIMRAAAPDLFHLIAVLADTVPAYRLEIGPDVSAIPSALAPLVGP